MMSHIPHLECRNGKTMLIVHDQPLILLAGEVHNSNSSSVEYMEGVWEKAEALGMNALMKYDVPTLLRLKVFIYG